MLTAISSILGQWWRQQRVTNCMFFKKWKCQIFRLITGCWRQLQKYLQTLSHFFSGAIWPQPKSQSSKINFNTIRPNSFSFTSIGYSCDILQLAFARYEKIIAAQLKRIRSQVTLDFNSSWRNENYYGQLNTVKVNLKGSCEKLPYLGMDESCNAWVENVVKKIYRIACRWTQLIRISGIIGSEFYLGNSERTWIVFAVSLYFTWWKSGKINFKNLTA